MAKIKICGLRREEDIAYVNECKPDYIGFVFAKSRRRVTKEQARKLRKLLSLDITPVGVFVNEEPERIAELVQEGIIDMIQLHGDEDEGYVERLRKFVKSAPIIKAVRVAGKEDIAKCFHTLTWADFLLFDTFSQKEYGGTGECFDWNLLKELKGGMEKPFFLAGGINSENVREALSLSNAFGVDVSSAVETDGVKDREKIHSMVKALRGAVN